MKKNGAEKAKRRLGFKSFLEKFSNRHILAVLFFIFVANKKSNIMRTFGYTSSKNNIRLETVISKLDAAKHFVINFELKLTTSGELQKQLTKQIKSSETISLPGSSNMEFVDFIMNEQNSKFLILKETFRSKDKPAQLKIFLEKIKTILVDEEIKNFFVIVSHQWAGKILKEFRKKLDYEQEKSLLASCNSITRFPIAYAMMMK